jgi:UDP-N-acetylglucosamine acyltransferase
MPKIHPTAVVSSEAQLGEDVEVGPYAIIDGPVKIGAGTVVLSHSHVLGKTTVGRNGRIGPAAYVGTPPQHLKADPSAGTLVVGDDAVIRETATLHRSIAAGDDRATRVGNRVFVMACGHVGHDSVVDDDAVLAHGVMLGGHVLVGAKAFIGGGAAVHQFCRVGRLSIIRGNEAVTQDVPPFASAMYGGMKGYNAVGVRRSGMPRASAQAIRDAYRCVHNHRLIAHAVAEIRREGLADVPEVAELLAFFATAKRGTVQSVRHLRHAAENDDAD